MLEDVRLHGPLIGRDGGRAALNTPALIVDLDALERNVAAMAAFAAARGVGLRPHAKTHKSSHIARLQMAAGAVGICCAKLGEAEAIAADGAVDSILITSPVVSALAMARLVALNARIGDLRVVVDHPDNVDALAAAAAQTQRPLGVVVDIDPGIRRTGVRSPEAALALAARIRQSPPLRFDGVQFYCGVHQHIASYADRRAGVEERAAYLRAIVDALAAAGAAPVIVTGGGTGTHRIDADLGLFTDLQVGSYVFMDRQYDACDLTGTGEAPYATALMVDARVVSANTPGMATVDAGFKALSTDGGSPTIIAGAPADAAFHFMGDEHGALVSAGHAFRLGDAVTLGAPHCDPTVNLYDVFHVVRGQTLVDIWPVTARGRSR
ncbi:MAG: DSD1 family PLP-dependent enzyme [Hyphomonadaceae bacterium]|nr:DSD1 family PLP-dependent enzyme [Hyphomonadaceae bacterium]